MSEDVQTKPVKSTNDARRGDYEPARQAASQFFTSLRAEIDKGRIVRGEDEQNRS